MPVLTICDNCPLLSDEYDACGLGYNVRYKSEKGGRVFVFVSDNCKLEVIKHAGIEYKPERRETEAK